MHRAQARVVHENDDRRLAELALADARDLLSTTLTASTARRPGWPRSSSIRAMPS
jgi:hypothetical protein